MTYDDDCEWRQDERSAWRREPLRRVAGERFSRGDTRRYGDPRQEDLRQEDPRSADARLPNEPTGRSGDAGFAERRSGGRGPAPHPAEGSLPRGSGGVTEISAMVDRIISQLDAVERHRNPPPREPARRAPAADPVASARPGPFSDALRHRRLAEKPADGEPPPSERRSVPAPTAALASPPPLDTIDRHFRVLAERVDLLRQRTDDRLGAVREDVARLTEAVHARPVAMLDPDDRAALDTLARRLDGLAGTGPETLDRLEGLRQDLARLGEAVLTRPADAFDSRDRAALDDIADAVHHLGRAAPETLDRIDAVQGDLRTLGRMVRELDLDKRLHALEAGQDAVIERMGDLAAQAGSGAAVDGIRRRVDWIAERLEKPPAADGAAALEGRLARLAADVQRLVDSPARGGGADGALARDVAAMRAELAELTRGGIVSQFDEIGSALARLAGEVKTAARSAGAETAPIVADLVRRIERLDRRLEMLPAGSDRDDRLAQIERMIAGLDRRMAASRGAAPVPAGPLSAAPVPVAPTTAAPMTTVRREAAPSDLAALAAHAPAPHGEPARAEFAPAVPSAPEPVRSETAGPADGRAAPPSRTSRLIAAARRAVDHPILARSGETPPAVVALASRSAIQAEPDFDDQPDAFPANIAGLAERPEALGGRRMLLLAAAVVGLIVGAYGFASEPLRTLVLTLSGDDAAIGVASTVPAIADPATTGSIDRAPDGVTAGGEAKAGRGAPIPSAASLPATLGAPGLRAAAADGDPRAALEVAVALIDGLGVKRDPQAAVPWLMLAADAGLAPAEFRLGTLYERGIGVARNRDTAKAWYDRAAGRGHVKAMHNLAVLLAEAGEGRDLARAVGWFEKAARFGLVDSQFNLAVLYVRGLGVAPDPIAAYRWFALASRQGDQEAGVRRDELGKDLAPADRAAADLAIAGWTPLPADATINEGSPLPQAWVGGGAPANG